MTKSKPTPASETTKKDAPAKKESSHDGGWRETFESIAMAVILALLFRGFVAEAFVIPTGSMAPTLQGRHKDVWCPKCGFNYQTTASREREEDQLTGIHVTTTTCPICRYTQTLDLFNKPDDHSFSGDRIIVAKFAYDLGEPQRWDIIVFKYPGNASQNYIKRLIGLPGERVRIVGGNIFTAPLNSSDDELRIARKPPHKLLALLQLVDDTNYIAKDLRAIGWPLRWQEWNAGGSQDPAWKTDDDGRTYATTGSHGHDAWLRYRHLIPSHGDWREITLQQQLPAGAADRRGQLITDFYAYNVWHAVSQDPAKRTSYLVPDSYDPAAYMPHAPGPGEKPLDDKLGQHWVDDLAVECIADVTSSEGELLLGLVRAGIRYECRISVADGKATLSAIQPDGAKLPFESDDGQTVLDTVTAATSIRGPGSYRLRMSNCDHEVLLWVNDSLVKFDGPTTYVSAELVAPVWSPADPGDLAPAGIGSRGAAVKLSDLRVFRDKYYIAATSSYDGNDFLGGWGGERLQRALRTPEEWETSGLFDPMNRRYIEFDLERDQFLPLGDNSPESSDGRFWGPPALDFDHHYVERDLLIGKALLIYWPHTWNRPIPFTPNFRKMGPVR
jgi:signal peptidase I